MKSPHTQRPDDEARELTEEFIASTRARRRASGPRSSRPSPPRPSSPSAEASASASIADGNGRHMLLPAPYGTGLEHVAREPLSIAQVSPHPWGATHEVNEFVERVSAGLADRGHRVVVAAPSGSRAAVRESRRAIASARRRPDALFDGAWKGERAGGDGGPPVLAVGIEPLDAAWSAAAGGSGPDRPQPPARGPARAASTSTSSTSMIRSRRARASVALRHSRSLNVGTFHEPTERVLSTQVARPAGGDLLRAARRPHGRARARRRS